MYFYGIATMILMRKGRWGLNLLVSSFCSCFQTEVPPCVVVLNEDDHGRRGTPFLLVVGTLYLFLKQILCHLKEDLFQLLCVGDNSKLMYLKAMETLILLMNLQFG